MFSFFENKVWKLLKLGALGTALLVILSATPWLRSFIAAPLIQSTPNPTGDAAYVLAGGYAIFERLVAAADLHQMERIKKIVLFEDTTQASYDFVQQRNLTESEWAVNFLLCRGVARQDILVLDSFTESALGTLSEARWLAGRMPAGVTKIVLVTSAPHTRRALLAFRRALPGQVTVIPVAAVSFRESAEFFYPIWLEYAKLFIYWLFA